MSGRRLQPVSKAANPLKLASGSIRRHPAQWSIGVSGAGAATGVAGQAPALDRHRDQRAKRRADRVAALGVGAAGGQGAWVGTGFGIRAAGHKAERTDNGLSRSQKEKIFRQHRKFYNVPNGGKPAPADQPSFYRNYPKRLPAAKYKRALGHMSGTKGKVLNGAAIGGGVGLALGADAAAHRHDVGKALFYQERRTSPVRTLETGAAIGIGAWGLGRSRMLGAALKRGVKASQRRDDAAAIRALQLAQSAQGVLRRGTAPGERAVRQVQAVNAAVLAVPAPLRGDVATAAGILLAGHAHPIRRTSYRQVSTPVAYRSF